MSVYNGEQHLAASIESICSQTLTDWELVVINDGSTDTSLSILNDFARQESRIRVIDQQNTGLTKALIRGCDLAKGEFIARQDADDWSHPQRLEKQLALFQRLSHISMASCFAEYVDDSGALMQRVERPADPLQATRCLVSERQGPPAHGTIMFRKRDYLAAGGYRPCFLFGQDSDLWLRLVDIGPIAYVPEVLYWWRMVPTGISLSRTSWQFQFGELGRAAHAARMAGQSDAPFVEQATALCEQVRMARDDPRTRQKLQVASLYRMGAMLSQQGNSRCRDYFWSVIQANPWHWKSWCRLTMEWARRFTTSRILDSKVDSTR